MKAPTEVMAAFDRVVAAVRARVQGRTPEPGPAAEVAAACGTDRLGPLEIELFEAGEEDATTELMRAAVVIGGVCARRELVAEPLRALGIDPDRLAQEGVAEVMRQMTAAARKHFADGDHDAAFRISELRTKHLSKHARKRDRAPGRVAPARPAVSSVSGGRVAGIATAVLCAVVIGWVGLSWLGGSSSALDARDLREISPFLDSGDRGTRNGSSVFVGELHPTWKHLEDAQRREEAERIGRGFAERGVTGVTLLDETREHQVEWRDGALVFLAASAADRP